MALMNTRFAKRPWTSPATSDSSYHLWETAGFEGLLLGFEI